MAERFHSHNELEGNIVIRGTASYRIFDRRIDLQRHSLLWLFPGQEHMLFRTSPDFEMWVWVIRPDIIKKLCMPDVTQPLLQNNPPDIYLRTMVAKDADRLMRFIRDFAPHTQDTDLQNTALLHTTNLAWLLWRQGMEATAAQTTLHHVVERAAELLNESEIDLPVLARKLRVSESYLSRLFHKQMGVTLVDFRNRVRVRRFLAIYAPSSTATILEAALQSGFGSYPQFNKVFKSVMGQAPSKFFRESPPAFTNNRA